MRCILKPVEEPETRPEIFLENGKAKVVGRGEETGIINKRCSKTQLELTANYKKKTVKVEQLGVNHSGINGKLIGMGMTEQAKENDAIDLLLGQRYLTYTVLFQLPPVQEGSPPRKIPRMFQPRSSSAESDMDALPEKGEWNSVGWGVEVYNFGYNLKDAKPNVGSFDIDFTLIQTKSGKKFPTNPDDWKFLYPQTAECLRKFFTEHKDFKFVMFTNQAGASEGTQKGDMKGKIEKITKQIGLPVLVFMATGKNKYRKPCTGNWDLFVKDYNGGVVPDLKSSFYCGDAAGRKKDFAMSDRLFALNIGLTFKVPEEFFLNSSRVEEMGMPLFDPKKFMANLPNNDHIKFPSGREMIVMVGFPGSGKSSYVKTFILTKGYVHVNRDTLKTPAKCLSVTDNALQNGDSVVIDNTNPEMKDRLEYIKLAKKYKVPYRCFKMNVDLAHALHNNKFRGLTNETHVSVPAVAFNTYKSRYQEPIIEEGYVEIVSVNFVPNFNYIPDEAEREYRLKLYGSYLSEK